MTIDYMQIIIIMIFMIIIILGIMIFVFVKNQPPDDVTPSDYFNLDIKNIHDIMANDSYLHRLLMIEIINDINEESPSTISKENTSQIVTFAKISSGVEILRKILVKCFGNTVSQKIASLMEKRNAILRNYYQLIAPIKLNKLPLYNQVSLDFNENQEDELINSKEEEIPDVELNKNISITDITTLTLRKLENVTWEITDSLSSIFHVKDPNQGNNVKSPITHYQKLFNLIVMYDKELVNQAKSYAIRQYDISMNYAQSSIEITHYIGKELNILIKDMYQKLM